MQIAEPILASWKAQLSMGFESQGGKTILSQRHHDGPLVVQKPLYPEGDAVCHAIVVHPPGGIVGGDELEISAQLGRDSHVLLTTPGAGKWYRSAGPWAKQRLLFEIEGVLEWLPRETIVFDGARAALECEVRLAPGARYIGWEVVCLGRTGSGERFERGEIRIDTRILRNEKLLWFERGRIEGGGRLMSSHAGLGGHSVCGTLLASAPELDSTLMAPCRQICDAVTHLPGLLVGRYLGDSSEEAMRCFARLWAVLRPALAGRQALAPRIWST